MDPLILTASRLRYAWDLDNDGAFDDGSASSASFTYTTSGQHQARLRVTDVGNESNTASVTIQVDNSYPSVQITSPAAGTTWAVGDTITFSGSAIDAQDGNLSNTLDWVLNLYHCAGAICHKHPITGWDNVAGASFVAPDHEYPSYLQLDVTATDSSGASSTASRRLDPQTVDLLFESAPSGLELVVGNEPPEATPFTRTVIKKSVNSLSAISPQTLSGSTYTFSQWSDGLAQTHQITANQAGDLPGNLRDSGGHSLHQRAAGGHRRHLAAQRVSHRLGQLPSSSPRR